MSNRSLSKSQFIRGRKCPKRLYIDYHAILKKPESSLFEQSLYEQGTEVGLLAQQLFPGGKDVRKLRSETDKTSAEITRELIDQGEHIIYEASFDADGLFAAVDILVKNGTGWDIFEVKSSGSIKENTFWDIAFQQEVLKRAGIRTKGLFAVFIDTSYKLRGHLDIDQFFKKKNVSRAVKKIRDQVLEKINESRHIIAQKEMPKTAIGPHCTQPHDCPYMYHCWEDMKEPSILELKGSASKKWELYERGIETMLEVPADEEMSAKQRDQVNAWVNGKEQIDRKELKAFLNHLTYPVLHLDFETYSAAIPIQQGHSPYQQIPFQYSIHKQNEPLAEAEHYEYLLDVENPSTRELLEHLLKQTEGDGSILAYNASFERSIFFDLLKSFPEYETEILQRVERITDLMTPFSKRWYYKAEMNGSASIKKVLPAIAPELSYKDLEISNGALASHSFLHLLQGDFQGDPEQLRKDLLEYCKLDTYSMVLILNKLYQSVAPQEQN